VCGIAGVFERTSGNGVREDLLRMQCDVLRHRGPDGQGVWIHPRRHVGMAHTRLSVIDLTAGAQPMAPRDGRFVIVHNGEIYNYRELRSELQGHGIEFATHSDTEVIIEAYRRWGNAALLRLRGMFAFALYDNHTDKLLLARDRTGIKPLYYYVDSGRLVFGSEIKAVLLETNIPREIDREALVECLVLGFALPPRTMFRGVRELEPGTFIELTTLSVRRERYWMWERNPHDIGKKEALEQAETVLARTVEEHLEADVPVGAFLSGGTDSSLVAAFASKRVVGQLQTFTVRFSEKGYDESRYAQTVARALGTLHREITIPCDSGEVELAVRVLAQFDQPFGDSSAIPTYLICKAIRQHVKVALAGDGADELFGGYRRFWYADIARGLNRLSPGFLEVLRRAVIAVGTFAPETSRRGARLMSAAQKRSDDRMVSLSCYAEPCVAWSRLSRDLRDEMRGYEPRLAGVFGQGRFGPGGEEFADATIGSVLAGDYLRKIDVMSGAHGLEIRVPFLGERVLDFAATIPHALKYSWRRNKILLRELVKQRLPRSIARKPKGGFGIPLDSWLGAQGRRQVADMISRPNARLRTLLDGCYLEQLGRAFTSQEWDRRRMSRFGLYQQVYLALGFETWLERWRPEL
jgi:asparagine synthase (glutamine-hydrolysing)